MIYKLNENNYIHYEIDKNFVKVKVIYYDDVNNLSQSINSYIDYFSTLDNVEFLEGYPGTCNPLIVRYVIDYFKNKKYNFRVFYDREEVEDFQYFEENILNPAVKIALTATNDNVVQTACLGIVGKLCDQSGFKDCCVFAPLKKNYSYIKTTVKYYEANSQGLIIQEYEEKPVKNKKYFNSTVLQELFKTHKIRLVDGKPTYSPKN